MKTSVAQTLHHANLEVVDKKVKLKAFERLNTTTNKPQTPPPASEKHLKVLEVRGLHQDSREEREEEN